MSYMLCIHRFVYIHIDRCICIYTRVNVYIYIHVHVPGPETPAKTPDHGRYTPD